MNETQARNALETILALMHQKNITYTDIQFTDGSGFVEEHIRRILRKSKGTWKDSLADQYIKNLESKIQIN